MHRKHLKKLHKFPLNSEQQANQLKKILPEFHIMEDFVEDKHIYRVEGKSNQIALMASYITKKIPNLRHTSYLDSYVYHSYLDIINLELQDDEIIVTTKVNLNIQGNTVENSVQITDINILNKTNKFDYLLNFLYEKNQKNN